MLTFQAVAYQAFRSVACDYYKNFSSHSRSHTLEILEMIKVLDENDDSPEGKIKMEVEQLVTLHAELW